MFDQIKYWAWSLFKAYQRDLIVFGIGYAIGAGALGVLLALVK